MAEDTFVSKQGKGLHIKEGTTISHKKQTNYNDKSGKALPPKRPPSDICNISSHGTFEPLNCFVYRAIVVSFPVPAFPLLTSRTE